MLVLLALRRDGLRTSLSILTPWGVAGYVAMFLVVKDDQVRDVSSIGNRGGREGRPGRGQRQVLHTGMPPRPSAPCCVTTPSLVRNLMEILSGWGLWNHGSAARVVICIAPDLHLDPFV